MPSAAAALVALLLAVPAAQPPAAPPAPPPPPAPQPVVAPPAPAAPLAPPAPPAPLPALMEALPVPPMPPTVWLDDVDLDVDLAGVRWELDGARGALAAALVDALADVPRDLAAAIGPSATALGMAPPPPPALAGAGLADVRSTAPAPWVAGDPADSIYRLAREALNRGDYRRAATLFQDLAARHARSAYAADAAYWEAFARYRLRTEPELRRALQVLDAQLARDVKSATTADARVLATRIRGELASWAAGGTAPGAWSRQLQQAARAGDGCDREEAAVRIEALGALAKIDSAAVVPTARRVLANPAPCAASLRERAALILARSGDPAATGLLAAAARGDASASVRAAALAGLARSRDDGALATIEEIALRPSTDERTAMAAVSALARSDHPRATPALRALAERAEAPMRVRASAIEELGEDTTAAAGAYLRALYARLDSTRLKEHVLAAAARRPGPEGGAWLAGVARDASEPMRLRRTALTAYARRDVPVADLARLYDAATEPELRDALVSTFARRREPAATDKLLAIARSDDSPRLRRAAIAALTRKDDPRTTRLLMEIIDRP